MNNLREENATMIEPIFLDDLYAPSDRLNVKLATYLEKTFESVSIYTGVGGPGTTAGPNTVWFDVNPSDGWLVIRRLQAFLRCYPLSGRLEPYTYLRDLPQLGWRFELPPSQVEVLEAFVRLQDVEEACVEVGWRIADRQVSEELPF